jgi:hypothetical protein
MIRSALLLICLAIFSCKSKKADDSNSYSYEDFDSKFKKGQLPFQISDTSIYRLKDTTTITSPELTFIMSDSNKTQLFGKPYHGKFYALAKFIKSKDEIYYLVHLATQSRRGLYLIVMDNKGNYRSSFPFLIDDFDASTILTSSIDRAYSISKTTIQKKSKGSNAERKEVYQYNGSNNRFNLIMMDAMGGGIQALINPIDSFSKKNKLAGDYIRGKNNLVSIRDGRHPNQLFVFVHIEEPESDCSGELKGDVLLTNPNSAIYRQGGDPCVLNFQFTGSSVSLKEQEGCGSHRGVNCLFDGSFQKKKPIKSKTKTRRTAVNS